MHHKKITNFGCGGIKCPCCTPFNTTKKNQKLSNKRLRRVLAAEIKEQENEWFHTNHMEGRETVEYPQVYPKNNFQR